MKVEDLFIAPQLSSDVSNGELMPTRFVASLFAFMAFSLGMALAINYPLGITISVAGFVLCAALGFYRPNSFWLIIPATLPILGFAPWTGWISFEELDLLVLALACGGYAKMAVDRSRPPPSTTSSSRRRMWGRRRRLYSTCKGRRS